MHIILQLLFLSAQYRLSMCAVVQTLSMGRVRLSADIEEVIMAMATGNILLIVLIMMLVGAITV